MFELVKQHQNSPIQQRLRGLDGNLNLLPEVINELVKSKRDGGRRPQYVKSLGHYLSRFSAGFPGKTIEEINHLDIESWLIQFQIPVTRQTWINRLSTFFSFAIRRGYRTDNPCLRIERITVVRKPPIIVTLEQSKTLLAWCKTAYKAYLILSMFAGIRPYEIERLDWDDIKLGTGSVRINFAKVQCQRRIVPLEPVAIKLLSRLPLQTGKVCPSYASMKRWKRACRDVLGLKRLPTDIFRHTAASYLIALHENVDKVAKDFGNSRKILLTHYHEPVSKAAAKEFFKFPEPPPFIPIIVETDAYEAFRTENDPDPSPSQKT